MWLGPIYIYRRDDNTLYNVGVGYHLIRCMIHHANIVGKILVSTLCIFLYTYLRKKDKEKECWWGSESLKASEECCTILLSTTHLSASSMDMGPIQDTPIIINID